MSAITVISLLVGSMQVQSYVTPQASPPSQSGWRLRISSVNSGNGSSRSGNVLNSPMCWWCRAKLCFCPLPDIPIAPPAPPRYSFPMWPASEAQMEMDFEGKRFLQLLRPRGGGSDGKRMGRFTPLRGCSADWGVGGVWQAMHHCCSMPFSGKCEISTRGKLPEAGPSHCQPHSGIWQERKRSTSGVWGAKPGLT